MDSGKTHYGVLQVSEEASAAVIRASYKALIQQYHPDRFKPVEEAHRMTQALNAAYAVLSDLGLRAEYDAFLGRQNEHRAAPREQEAPPTKPHSPAEKARTNVRPWVRFWARWLDVTGFSLAAVFALGFFASEVVMEMNPLALGLLIVLAWAPVEAVLLSTFGTTPGKWLLRIDVQAKGEEGVSFPVAFERSIRVWWRGLGAGVPLVNIATLLSAYSTLKTHGTTTWDRDGELTITHQAIGPFRGAAAALVVFAFALTIGVFGLLDEAAIKESVAARVAEMERERQVQLAREPEAAAPADQAPVVESWEAMQDRFFANSANQFIRVDNAVFNAWEVAMQTVVNEAARGDIHIGDWDLMQEARDRVALQAYAPPMPAPIAAPPRRARQYEVPTRHYQTPREVVPYPTQAVSESLRRYEELRASRGGASNDLPSWDEMKPQAEPTPATQ